MGRNQTNSNLLLFCILMTAIANASGELAHSILCEDQNGTTIECNTACVNKFGLDRTTDVEGHALVVRRYGCEGKMISKTLQEETSCDFRISEGHTYEFVYYIFDPETNADLRVTKLCCWFNLCNNRKKRADQRFLYHPKSDIYRSLYRAIVDSKVYFSLLLAFVLLMTVVVLYEIYKTKTKVHRSKLCDYNDDIEQSMVEISKFDSTRIVDTRTLVSGQMTIKELSRVLALFPSDESITKKSTTTSTESSNAERRVKNNVTTRKQLSINIAKPLLSHTAGYGQDLFATTRIVATPRSFLYRLVEHGPYQFPFDVIELLQLIDETYYICQQEKSLLKVEAGCTIIGDIRGKYIELHRWLQLTGWPPNNKLLFLGGMVDNDSMGSVETLALICALKCCFPKHVFMLRGVPESTPFFVKNRFDPQIARTVQSAANRLFNNLSVAATVGSSIFAVYSGFSPFVRGKKSFMDIEKPIHIDSDRSIVKDVVFNRPSPDVRMYRRNPNNGGLSFGNKAVIRALKLTDCQLMVRARNPVKYGYMSFWRNRLLSIYSVPLKEDGYGCVLSVSRDMHITPIMIKSHHRAPERKQKKFE